jgi:hypothetical protein
MFDDPDIRSRLGRVDEIGTALWKPWPLAKTGRRCRASTRPMDSRPHYHNVEKNPPRIFLCGQKQSMTGTAQRRSLLVLALRKRSATSAICPLPSSITSSKNAGVTSSISRATG